MGRDAVSLARKIHRLPQLAERVAAGAISVKDATVVGQALDRLRPHVDQADGLIDGQSAEEALSGVLVDGVCQLVGESS